MFGAALRHEFPTVVFIDHTTWKQPHIPVCSSPLDCEEHRQIDILVPEVCSWSPVVKRSKRWNEFYLGEDLERSLTFHPSRWDWGPRHIEAKWAWDAPTLAEGLIGGGYWPEEKKQIAFIRAAWRIIERVASNRYKGGHPLGNELMHGDRSLMAESEGDVWIGHHALEWSRAGGPRRMLDGSFRPCDDWEPPQDDWYRSLREEVLARYGPDLGVTPSEPPY